MVPAAARGRGQGPLVTASTRMSRPADTVETPVDAVDYCSRLMTVEDVCTYLGVSCDFVYDQVRLGTLRCSRLARQLRFRLRDVDAFVDDHLVNTPGGSAYPQPVRQGRAARLRRAAQS
jgi:excisionase family DNA binding protein